MQKFSCLITTFAVPHECASYLLDYECAACMCYGCVMIEPGKDGIGLSVLKNSLNLAKPWPSKPYSVLTADAKILISCASCGHALTECQIFSDSAGTFFTLGNLSNPED